MQIIKDIWFAQLFYLHIKKNCLITSTIKEIMNNLLITFTKSGAFTLPYLTNDQKMQQI